MLDATPRERIIEYLAGEIKHGLSHNDLLTALTQVAFHTIQPYPDVGFKYHGVMMLQSLHLSSRALTDMEKWLPLLWGVDEFKRSQSLEQNQTGWRMPVVSAKKTNAARAQQELLTALESWDHDAAETAVMQLIQATSPAQAMAVLMPFLARDYRALGHKPITGANAHRMLRITGAHASVAILRSTTAAILNHAGESNPAINDHPADRAWKQNVVLIQDIAPDWQQGKMDREAVKSMLDIMRSASDLEASREAVRLLAGGSGPRVIWEALLAAAGEMMLRTGSFFALHANTMINALHYLYLHADNDVTRRLLLLQSTALLARFRTDIGTIRRDLKLDEMEPLETTDPEAIFATMGNDRLTAARLTSGYLNSGKDSGSLLKLIRHYTVYRTGNAHDYKYAEAVIENYQQMSSTWRNHYLSSAMFSLNGPRQRPNQVVNMALDLLNSYPPI